MNVNRVRNVIIYGSEIWEFYDNQNPKIKSRIDWTIRLVSEIKIYHRDISSIKQGQIYEIRITSGSNIYRVFSFFDKGNLIVVLYGFQKKSQKTPRNQIVKALKLKEQYYEEKQK